jgi:hypothetical protein
MAYKPEKKQLRLGDRLREAQQFESKDFNKVGLNRYRLTPDEALVLENYREQKSVLIEECEKAKINPDDVKHWWYKSKHISAFVKPRGKTLDDLKTEMIADIRKYSPKFKIIKRTNYKESYCLVLDLADLHIGKLASDYETGENYNNNIAVKRAKEGIEKILRYTSGYNIDKIVFIIGNDILHVDNNKRTTTSGTPQDTDGQWYDNFIIAQKLYVAIIDMLLPISDIHIVHNVSNHDYMAGWYLSQVIQAWYKNCKNVTFDCNMRHRKAFVYHDNLIGTSHGDGAKEHDLPILLAQEFRQEWAVTKYRYIHTHHTHHKYAKERTGVTIETSRSASATDGWHHKSGYQHAIQAVEAFLYSKKGGQIARFTAIVE